MAFYAGLAWSIPNDVNIGRDRILVAYILEVIQARSESNLVSCEVALELQVVIDDLLQNASETPRATTSACVNSLSAILSPARVLNRCPAVQPRTLPSVIRYPGPCANRQRIWGLGSNPPK